MSRSIVRFALSLMLMLLASAAWAKKPPKEKPLKSNAGGAGKAWACKKLADSACDLAKRCEPDRCQRYCRKVRERCDDVKDGNANHATDDDVGTCNDSLPDLSCHQVTFDNVNGVVIDFKHLELCSPVYQDNLLPMMKDDSSDKGDKPKDDKAASEKGKDDKAASDAKSGDDDAPKKKSDSKKHDSDD